MTSHIGTNTPKFVPPRRGRPLRPYSNGAVQIRVGLELAEGLNPKSLNKSAISSSFNFFELFFWGGGLFQGLSLYANSARHWDLPPPCTEPKKP